MSHFTVLVPAQGEDELEARLLPFHEYECTGINEYLEWVDMTDEAREEYEQVKTKFVRLADSTIMSAYDDTFYRKNPVQTWKDDGPFYPDGSKVVEMTRLEASLESFEEFAQSWYNAIPIPGHPDRLGRLTNPNAQWDWWQVGGRWTGTLKLKSQKLLRGQKEVAGLNRNEVNILVEMYINDLEKFERIVQKYDGKSEEIRTAVKQLVNGGFVRPETAENGSPGLMTEPNQDNERADAALHRDVDWEGMKEERRKERAESWQRFHDGYNNATPSGEMGGWEKSERPKEIFGTLENYQKFLAMDNEAKGWLPTYDEIEEYLTTTKEEYANKIRALTWAFIDTDGNWVERADMGWWGCYGDVESTYEEAFWRFVDSLDPNQKVYVVDCHI